VFIVARLLQISADFAELLSAKNTFTPQQELAQLVLKEEKRQLKHQLAL
jgi:hypothetical protein